MHKAVGGVKLYDRFSVIGVERRRPTVDDGARLLGWTSKRLRRQEHQKRDQRITEQASAFSPPFVNGDTRTVTFLSSCRGAFFLAYDERLKGGLISVRADR